MNIKTDICSSHFALFSKRGKTVANFTLRSLRILFRGKKLSAGAFVLSVIKTKHLSDTRALKATKTLNETVTTMKHVLCISFFFYSIRNSGFANIEFGYFEVSGEKVVLLLRENNKILRFINFSRV